MVIPNQVLKTGHFNGPLKDEPMNTPMILCGGKPFEGIGA